MTTNVYETASSWVFKKSNPCLHFIIIQSLNPKPMASFKTLTFHRRQSFRNSTHFSNSIRQQFSSIEESNFDSGRRYDDGDDRVGDCKENGRKEKEKEKKPLHLMFGEAVGLIDVRDMSDKESEDERRMIRNLKKLEKEISRLKEVKAEGKIDFVEEKIKKSESLLGLFGGKNLKHDGRQMQECVKDSGSDENKAVKPGRLSAMFSQDNVKRVQRLNRDVGMDAAELVVLKKLSTEMLMFIELLYKGGYFYDANFLPGNKFDASYFEDSYSREYVKFAAARFVKDHQEIAKWLSGSQVKAVALHGCPTLIKKTVFAAKRLRAFFKIREDTVCSKCVLKDSCKFVNQSVWNGDSKNLSLDDTMRVILFYGLEAVHPKLPLPDHFKATVNHLLMDIINLSKSTS